MGIFLTESKKEFIRGQFSSRNKNAPETNEVSGDEINVYSYLSKKERNKFERMLEKRLAIYPDVMDIKRIVSIIGYTERTIRWHIGKGRNSPFALGAGLCDPHHFHYTLL